MIILKSHWNSVYHSKLDSALSWTQPDPRTSLDLIREVCPSGRIIDAGGGTSSLHAKLLDEGHSVAVLDISESAIAHAKQRLGERAGQISWIGADITTSPELGKFDLWHDRALFHFLTEPQDRAAYVALVSRSIFTGGHVIIATFAPDGPEQCSGLPVRRYDAPSLAAELGEHYELITSVSETHFTPWGKPQAFQYCVFQRI